MNVVGCVSTLDPDTREVVTLLREAIEVSGLSQNVFAKAVGSSSGRMSKYLYGRIRPSAYLCMRARRLGFAIGASAGRGLWSAPVTGVQLRHALASPGHSGGRDDRAVTDRAMPALLRGRTDLRAILAEGDEVLVASWEAEPVGSGSLPWDTLLAAVAMREFEESGRAAPEWTRVEPLPRRWAPHGMAAGRDRGVPEWLLRFNIMLDDSRLVPA